MDTQGERNEPIAANGGGRSGPDTFDPPPTPGASTAWRDALIGAAAWLGAMAVGGFVLDLAFGGPDGLGSAAVAAIVLAATAPFAVMFGLASVAARIDALERRIAALGRAQSRLFADLPRMAARRPEAPGSQELASAMAAAAREALDAERAAMARQIAEIGETQRRLVLAMKRLDTAPGAPAAAEPPAAEPPAPEPEPQPRSAPAVIPNAPPRAEIAEDPQAALPLAGEPSPAPSAIDWSVIAVALNFPQDETDAAGFAALDAAVRDPSVSALLQAAEDALTMLAQRGVYMEDLEVRLAPASAWSRFASGVRGPEVAAVGGVESAETVEAVRGMMKADPIFRDTAMHLMRRFDGVLRRAVDDPRAAPQLPAIADSRTGRAFMLVAQAVGAFD